VRLRRSDLSKPGITRRRRGKGFEYRQDGDRVTDPATLERITALVTPPAWKDVWICADPRGHIQAVGVDAAGRRQYRYHDQWRAQRDRRKFEHMLEVAEALPSTRERVTRHLTGHGLTRQRVLAATARLLDTAAIRVGGEAYAVDDPLLGEATFGLATLRRDHVSARGDVVRLSFAAKGGVEAATEVTDEDLAAVVKQLLKRDDPGEELFAYHVDGQWRDVRSADINDYLREVSGIELTAKDFRTWHGTVAAALSLALAPPATSRTARQRAVAAAMREASELLGNTPAVARKSYVDPRIVDLYQGGTTVPDPGMDEVAAVFADRDAWTGAEKAVIQLLTA
jgi:DNA topoisomerase I